MRNVPKKWQPFPKRGVITEKRSNIMDLFGSLDSGEMAVRLAAAALCGAVLGLDR